MAKVSVSLRVAADADAIWEQIGDFDGLSRWAAGVRASAADGRDVGAVRTVEMADGRRLQERLESYDEVGRSYGYALIEGAPTTRDYVATLKVWADRDGAEIVWSSEFEVVGAPEDEICAQIEAFYRESLENVKARFA